jgi:hypothetical protein
MTTWDTLVQAIKDAGHFCQFRTVGGFRNLQCISHRSREGRLHGKQCHVFLDECDNWHVTVFGEKTYRIPDASSVAGVCIDLMREIDSNLRIPDTVISRYGLILTSDPHFTKEAPD